MRFYTDGKTFKASHISGPTHNYLGLSFAESGDTGVVTVEPLTLNDQEPAKLDAAEVQEWVTRGVDRANRDLATHYRLKRIEFVVSDSKQAGIYEMLARHIVKRVHTRRETYNGTDD